MTAYRRLTWTEQRTLAVACSGNNDYRSRVWLDSYSAFEPWAETPPRDSAAVQVYGWRRWWKPQR